MISHSQPGGVQHREDCLGRSLCAIFCTRIGSCARKFGRVTPLPTSEICYNFKGLEGGGQGRNRTTDTRIFSRITAIQGLINQ